MRVLSVFALVFLSLIAFIPKQQALDFLNQLPEVCPLKRWTGLECAFCGMTHAWISILHGDFRQAYHYNALSIPLFVATVIVLMVLSLSYRTSTKHYLKRRRPLVWLVIIGLCAYALFRNL